MAAAQKIRGAAPLPAKLAGLLREAKWLALVAAAGYLLLILLTHHATDPGWSRSATSAVVQNAGGRVGAWLSDVLLSLFGWSAFWWAALCLYTVVRGYRRIENTDRIETRPLLLSIAGFGLLLVASAALESLRLHGFGAGLPQGAGGIIGNVLGGVSLRLVGFTGATLLTLAAIGVGWSLFSTLSVTTSVVQINDLVALEQILSQRDIAAMLIEPALTNIGIVLPDDGYHAAVRELCTRYGTLLIIDETHTFSAGPGGMIGTADLHPDAVVLGKSIGGGIPAGAYGMTREFARDVRNSLSMEDIDVGGVGGTLAGNAVSLAGIRATLSQVLTPAAFPGMIERCAQWTAGVQSTIDEFGIGWQVTQLGARAEYSFLATAPHDGREAAEADDFELQQYLHLHALNRGILMTPFHNMALMCPETSSADVERHTVAFREAAASLYA